MPALIQLYAEERPVKRVSQRISAGYALGHADYLWHGTRFCLSNRGELRAGRPATGVTYSGPTGSARANITLENDASRDLGREVHEAGPSFFSTVD